MLSATKLRELLRSVGVVNAYLFAKVEGSPVYIDYRVEERGRAYQSAAWQVSRCGFKTDPDAHWRDAGKKTFLVHGRDKKAPQEAAAKTWASERFGVTEWAKTPFGTWMEKAFVERRLAELLERAEAVSAGSGTSGVTP